MTKKIPTITINLDKKCANCGKGGAAQGDFCMGCLADWVGGKIKLNNQTYREYEKRKAGEWK